MMRIGDRRIGAGAPCFVIAEIGINHDGDEALAAEMVAAAAEAGADAVKFQTVDAAESYLPGTASFTEFSGRALSRDAYARLRDQARALGVVPFSTPGDLSSLSLLVGLGFEAIKISSGQMTNTPILRAAAATGLPLIVSTGMADMAGVERAMATLAASGSGPVALLHCVSLYPARFDQINLLAMGALERRFGVPVGYSDHCLATDACTAAALLGAAIIEKHFTLDSTRPGADHALSSEPAEFAAMVAEIRLAEAARGHGEKRPTEEEVLLAPSRWRHLVAARDLAEATVLAADDLLAKRVPEPAGGILALDIDLAVGRRLRRALSRDALVRPEDLAP